MSSPNVVGSAVVVITADLKAFADDARVKVEALMQELAPLVEEGLSAAAEGAGPAGTAAGAEFGGALHESVVASAARLDETVTGALDGTAVGAAAAGTRTGEALTGGMAESIRAGAAGVAASTEQTAAEAGRRGESTFSEYGTRAGERFTEGAKEGLLAGKEALLAGIGALGFGELAKGSIEAADSLENTSGRIERMFGESGDSVKEWAQNVSAHLRESTLAIDQQTAGFGGYLGGLGLSKERAGQLSEQLVSLTANMAAYNNTDTTTMSTAIAGALKGRTAALKQYHVTLNTAMIDQAALNHQSELGTIAMKNGQPVLTTQQTALATMYAVMGQTKNQMHGLADTADTMKGRQESLTASWANGEAAIGGELLPILTTLAGYLVNDVVPAFIATGHWVNQNKAWLEPLAVGIGAVLLAYKGTTLAVDGFKTAQAALRGVMALAGSETAQAAIANEAYDATLIETGSETAAAAAAQDVLNTSFEANPIGLVVAAIAALVVGLIYAYNHFTTFRNIVNDVFSVIKTIVVGYIHILIAEFHALTAAGVAVWHFLEAAWNNVGKPVVDFIRAHWGLLLAALTGGFSLLIQHWRAVWSAVQAVWTDVGRPVFNAIETVVSTLVSGIGTAASAIGNSFESVWTAAKRWFGDIVTFVQGIPGDLEALAGKMLDAGKNLIRSFLSGLAHAAGGIGDVASSIVNDMIDFINSDIIDPLKNFTFTVGAFGVHHTFQPFGSLPDIPQLATGGLTTGPMTALIGDNASGNELVMPMDDPATVALLSAAISRAVPGSGGLGGLDPSAVALLRSIDAKLDRLDRLEGIAGIGSDVGDALNGIARAGALNGRTQPTGRGF